MASTGMRHLLYLISHAELVGSRGRARYYGTVEPTHSDFDYTIWTNDPELAKFYREVAALVAAFDSTFRIVERHDGFTLHGIEVDINVYPTRHRDVLRLAWALMETGISKLEAWREAHRRLNYPCED